MPVSTSAFISGSIWLWVLKHMWNIAEANEFPQTKRKQQEMYTYLYMHEWVDIEVAYISACLCVRVRKCIYERVCGIPRAVRWPPAPSQVRGWSMKGNLWARVGNHSI